MGTEVKSAALGHLASLYIVHYLVTSMLSEYLIPKTRVTHRNFHGQRFMNGAHATCLVIYGTYAVFYIKTGHIPHANMTQCKHYIALEYPKLELVTYSKYYAMTCGSMILIKLYNVITIYFSSVIMRHPPAKRPGSMHVGNIVACDSWPFKPTDCTAIVGQSWIQGFCGFISHHRV